MPDDPLVDYLERTFAEAYRKEIDQEENVWRSLPFFAATLALQLAALAQVKDWVGQIHGAWLTTTIALLILAGIATLAAIVFLAASVWPAEFRYSTSELQLRAYAEKVRVQVGNPAGDPEAKSIALLTVKTTLIEQYGAAATNNRAIIRRRSRWRTQAALATLLSVFAVLVLVALVVVSNLHVHATEASRIDGSATGPDTRTQPRPTEAEQGPAAPDARGTQGMVARHRDGTSGIGPH